MKQPLLGIALSLFLAVALVPIAAAEAPRSGQSKAVAFIHAIQWLGPKGVVVLCLVSAGYFVRLLWKASEVKPAA